MPFKIVRNDITKMNTEAIVNTANEEAIVGSGCDYAIYTAAGYDKLLQYRIDNIGYVPEGKAFVTPGYDLPAKYIIHAVSPYYTPDDTNVERKLRACYKNSLMQADLLRVQSIAFPLIASGGFQYPREEAMSIALEEIRDFLAEHEMTIYLVVFDDATTDLSNRLYPGLESYIDSHYVEKTSDWEYAEETALYDQMLQPLSASVAEPVPVERKASARPRRESVRANKENFLSSGPLSGKRMRLSEPVYVESHASTEAEEKENTDAWLEDVEVHEKGLRKRLGHLADTFSEYLLFLIQNKNMTNPEVYNRALVDKRTFAKIKNNKNYHPDKRTALQLCVGAKLNPDETRDLLARAGYALSPCDKTDIIFSYFIENAIYDMIELDIQLEEHGIQGIIA